MSLQEEQNRSAHLRGCADTRAWESSLLKAANATVIAALWVGIACGTGKAKARSESDAVRISALQELILGTERRFVCLSVHPGVVGANTALSDLSDARDPSPQLLQDAGLVLGSVYPGSSCYEFGDDQHSLRHRPSDATGGMRVVLGPVFFRGDRAQVLGFRSRGRFQQEWVLLRLRRTGDDYDVAETMTLR